MKQILIIIKTAREPSDNTTIEALIAETYDSTTLISDTIKNANNFIDFVNDSIQKIISARPQSFQNIRRL